MDSEGDGKEIVRFFLYHNSRDVIEAEMCEGGEVDCGEVGGMIGEGIFWEYKGLIEFMGEHPAMYGLDNKRAELHQKLEKIFPNRIAELKIVLHDLPKGFMYADLVWAINNIKDFKSLIGMEK